MKENSSNCGEKKKMRMRTLIYVYELNAKVDDFVPAFRIGGKVEEE